MTVTLLLLSSTLSCLSFVLAWTCFLKPSFTLLRETDAWGDLAPAFPDPSNSCALARSSCYSLRSSPCLKLAASNSSHPGGTCPQSRWEDDSMSCVCAFTQIPPWYFPGLFPQLGVEQPRRRPQEVGWGWVIWSQISWPLLGGSTQGHRTVGKYKRVSTKTKPNSHFCSWCSPCAPSVHPALHPALHRPLFPALLCRSADAFFFYLFISISLPGTFITGAVYDSQASCSSSLAYKRVITLSPL